MSETRQQRQERLEADRERRAELHKPADYPVRLERRSVPEQLRYLAAKLREGEQWRESVALSLDVIALELSGPDLP